MPGTSFRTWARGNWQSVVFYLVCIALIAAAVLYTWPFQLKDLLGKELGGMEDIKQLQIVEMSSSPYLSYIKYLTTDPEEIAAVLSYLEAIKIQRVFIAPDEFYGSGRHDSYMLHLADQKGKMAHLDLTSGYLTFLNSRKGKFITYKVQEPDDFLDFYDLIKDFPQQ